MSLLNLFPNGFTNKPTQSWSTCSIPTLITSWRMLWKAKFTFWDWLTLTHHSQPHWEPLSKNIVRKVHWSVVLPRKVNLTSMISSPGLESTLIQHHRSFTLTLKHLTDTFSTKKSKSWALTTLVNLSLKLRKGKLKVWLIKRKQKKLNLRNQRRPKLKLEKLRRKANKATKVSKQVKMNSDFCINKHNCCDKILIFIFMIY